MGLRGPAPTPSAVRQLRGNPGKRALPKNEPKAERGVPPMPRHLSPVARAWWKRIASDLHAMGVLALVDEKALELLVEAYAEWRAASAAVRKDGRTYESATQNGTIIRPNPDVAIAADAWRRVKAMMAEFGLTPSARTRVQGEGEGEVDPFEEMLRGPREA